MKALIIALMSLMAFSEATPFYYGRRNPCDHACSYAYAQCKTYPYGKNHPIYPPHHPHYDASEEDDDAVDDASPIYYNNYRPHKPSLYFPCKTSKCFIQCSNGKPVSQQTAPGTIWCQTKKTSGKQIHEKDYNGHHCLNLKSYRPHHPHYPKHGSHYPPHGSHYPKHGSHYPKHGSHYPKHGSHYPPHGSHYPKHGSHYPKHGSHYPPHGSHYPSHGSHYPPHGSHNSHDY